jgi:hypothetical protein
MPEKLLDFIKTCIECSSLLFVANIKGKSDKQIRGIRIAETVIGTLICTIILGGLGSYIVLSKLETAFKHQNIYINTQLEHVEKKRLEDKDAVRRELDNIMYDIRELRGD